MDKFMQDLMHQLKRHEGLSLTLYQDSVGVPTIGYGHNAMEPISIEAAIHILEDDICTAMEELDRRKPFWRMLPRDARMVVLNMCFNLGWTKYQEFVRFWVALEFHNYRQAAREMRDSRWYIQVKGRGEELAVMMENVQRSESI